jgi:hypothetical protein
VNRSLAKQSWKLFRAVQLHTRGYKPKCDMILKSEDQGNPYLAMVRTGRLATRWVDDTIDIVNSLVMVTAEHDKLAM